MIDILGMSMGCKNLQNLMLLVSLSLGISNYPFRLSKIGLSSIIYRLRLLILRSLLPSLNLNLK